jgi:hypothetical protein
METHVDPSKRNERDRPHGLLLRVTIFDHKMKLCANGAKALSVTQGHIPIWAPLEVHFLHIYC